MANTQVNEAFLKFLNDVPEALAKFVDIVNEFRKIQGETNIPVSTGMSDGPLKQRPGDTVNVDVIPITDAQLQALRAGMADAQVKETMIACVKAFITGAMILA